MCIFQVEFFCQSVFGLIYFHPKQITLLGRTIHTLKQQVVPGLKRTPTFIIPLSRTHTCTLNPARSSAPASTNDHKKTKAKKALTSSLLNLRASSLMLHINQTKLLHAQRTPSPHTHAHSHTYTSPALRHVVPMERRLLQMVF